MQPLDLSSRAPRPCRAELGGIVFLPRAIDKVRASLPGGNMGPYLSLMGNVPTLSSLFYRRMGVTHDAFVDAVAVAADEEAVVAWLLPQIPEGGVEKLKQQMFSITLGGLGPARATVNGLYAGAAASPDDMLLIDMIDADDAAMFAAGKP